MPSVKPIRPPPIWPRPSNTIPRGRSKLFDLSLQGVIRAMAEPEIARLTGRARQLALFDYAANATYLNAILVLDETGEIIDDSRSLVPPELNLADRDYFQVHRDNPDVGMYLSHPFKSRFHERGVEHRHQPAHFQAGRLFWRRGRRNLGPRLFSILVCKFVFGS